MPTDPVQPRLTRTYRAVLELLADRPLYISRKTSGLSVASATATGLVKRGLAMIGTRADGVRQLMITKAGRRLLDREATDD